jgi:mycofactocin precursor
MNEPAQSSITVIERPDEPVEPENDEQLVEDDLLVEEVSIDGMCGVY